MKLLLSLVLFSIPMFLTAGDKVDKSLAITSDVTVHINNVRGKVSVLGWDNNSIQVQGELDDNAESLVFEQKGDDVFIRVVLPEHQRMKGRSGSKLIISLPKASRTIFSGVSTDVSLKTMMNDVTVTSVSGDIRLQNIVGSITVNSVSGEVELAEISGNLKVSTISGNIAIQSQSQMVDVSSISADMAVNLEHVNKITVSSVSGDFALTGSLNAKTQVDVSNVSGEARIIAANVKDVAFELQAGPGGDIVNQLNTHQNNSQHSSKKSVKFVLGKGDGLVKMSTVSGTLVIKELRK